MMDFVNRTASFLAVPGFKYVVVIVKVTILVLEEFWLDKVLHTPEKGKKI